MAGKGTGGCLLPHGRWTSSERLKVKALRQSEGTQKNRVSGLKAIKVIQIGGSTFRWGTPSVVLRGQARLWYAKMVCCRRPYVESTFA